MNKNDRTSKSVREIIEEGMSGKLRATPKENTEKEKNNEKQAEEIIKVVEAADTEGAIETAETAKEEVAAGNGEAIETVSESTESENLEVEIEEDINALDAANKLAVVEYVDHIFKFYKSIIEEEGRDYMGSQPELNITMRSILIVDMVRGVTVYENPFYVSPNQIRALEKRNKAGNFAKKIKEERCLNSLTH
ncbi:hypothetical protein YC2023_004589 [Brassica napus]